jgi:tetratricopeptide (TPR) repeat protein
MRAAQLGKWLVSTLLALSSCHEKPDAPAPAASAVPPSVSAPPTASGCAGGKSLDPPSGELRPAMGQFKDKHYQAAQHALDQLAKTYPKSATVLVWRGDATLFDTAKSETDAATAAIPFYQAAERLHDAGCKLPEYEEYYLRMGLAYAHLRKREAKPAEAELELAKQRWHDDSAEIYYHLARAHCLAGDVDGCVEDFEKSLVIAKSLKRPLFLRTHHSLEDWIRRSRTQSEFGPLRKDPRYTKIIAKLRRN